MHNPSKEHWAVVKQILRYLKDIIAYGLTFNRSPSLQLFAYSNAEKAQLPK